MPPVFPASFPFAAAHAVAYGLLITRLSVHLPSAYPLPALPRRLHVQVDTANTPVSDSSPDHFLHHIAAGPSSGAPLVMMPGYGAGAAFYFRSVSPLASTGLRVFAVDWLGTGLSGRPRFHPRGYEQSVAWFTDSLEEWRRRNHLERFTLLGHSLGGYLAACYALKYPERVDKLILVGPAGVAARPGPPPDSLLYKVIASAWEVRGP